MSALNVELMTVRYGYCGVAVIHLHEVEKQVALSGKYL